jgi:hypothetical protein
MIQRAGTSLIGHSTAASAVGQRGPARPVGRRGFPQRLLLQTPMHGPAQQVCPTPGSAIVNVRFALKATEVLPCR